MRVYADKHMEEAMPSTSLYTNAEEQWSKMLEWTTTFSNPFALPPLYLKRLRS
jgi:hypothetical protein